MENDFGFQDSSIEIELQAQAQRIQDLRRASTNVCPRWSGRTLLDSPIESIYELGQVSATRSYLRFFSEATEENLLGLPLPVIGELVHDWAVTSQEQLQGRVVVMPGTNSMTCWRKNGELETIASSATSFRQIYQSFVEFRGKASNLDFDEFGDGFRSKVDEEVYLDLSRAFWVVVAQTDPQIFNSGSRFWFEFAANATSWRAEDS